MTTIPDSLIEKLENPFDPQGAFSYSVGRWREWTGHLPGVQGVLADLPGEVDRRDVATRVDALLPENPQGAFVVSMIWGHGSSNYGPYRTACVLTGSKAPKSTSVSDDVVDKLSESVTVARELGAVEGYRYLNNRGGKMSGLGPAFFTKWLYFITARGQAGARAAAPVLDALVLEWLRRSADVRLRPGRTDDYARYLALLEEWGAPYGKTAVEVEERIFRAVRTGG